ncbi:MAG: Fic family protein [Candidatus Campbellbacteria bacterium]|nr:Fic family protein [Candidatus Campbellbacteria bacterium]
MDTSLNDSQKNNIKFLTEKILLGLYEAEYEKEYLTSIFGEFLPTEKEKWVKEMASIMSTVETRSNFCNMSLDEAVARVMFCIIKGHKLVDGNKRSSILCMVGLYALNLYVSDKGVGNKERFTFDPESLYHKVKEIAALDSQTIDDEKVIVDLTEFLKTKK